MYLLSLFHFYFLCPSGINAFQFCYANHKKKLLSRKLLEVKRLANIKFAAYVPFLLGRVWRVGGLTVAVGSIYIRAVKHECAQTRS